MASSASTTSDPRTKAFGQACMAMRLPTAAGQAANASWSAEIASESLSLARDLPARSIRTELNFSIHGVSIGLIESLHGPDGDEQAASEQDGGQEECCALLPGEHCEQAENEEGIHGNGRRHQADPRVGHVSCSPAYM